MVTNFKQMKKIILIATTILLSMATSHSVFAQRVKKEMKKIWASDASYEVTVVDIGTDGTKLLKVWGYAKKKDIAKINAKKNAVAACLFKGAVGNRDKIVKPIIPNPNTAEKHQVYFDNFFKTGGDYLKYVGLTNDATGKDIIKMKKGYKVGIVASVNYDALRKEMERAGIVKELSKALGDIAKKPTIMVVPSDNWCVQNGFVMEFNDQGTKRKLPDYKAAVQGSSDLLLVIGKLNTLMADRGFPAKNLETEMKNINNRSAEESMIMSKETGSNIAESPIDMLKKTAKADILIQVTWSVNTTGAQKSVTFNLQGIDAYSGKQVAGSQGTGAKSFSAELPLLLEEAVLAHLDNFNTQLMTHFNDLAKNGREVMVQIKVFDDAEFDLEEEFEFDGEEDELSFHIENWFTDNCVNGKFNLSDGSENFMKLEQVRIPMFYERKGKKRAMDTRKFVNNLRKVLKKEPFNIDSKLYMRGLGEAWLIIGSK